MKEMTAEELEAYEWAFEQKRRGRLRSAGAATRYAYTLANYLQRPPRDTEREGAVEITVVMRGPDLLREFSDEQIHNEAARRRWVYKKLRRVAYQRVIDPDTGESKYHESECKL